MAHPGIVANNPSYSFDIIWNGVIIGRAFKIGFFSSLGRFLSRKYCLTMSETMKLYKTFVQPGTNVLIVGYLLEDKSFKVLGKYTLPDLHYDAKVLQIYGFITCYLELKYMNRSFEPSKFETELVKLTSLAIANAIPLNGKGSDHLNMYSVTLDKPVDIPVAPYQHITVQGLILEVQQDMKILFPNEDIQKHIDKCCITLNSPQGEYEALMKKVISGKDRFNQIDPDVLGQAFILFMKKYELHSPNKTTTSTYADFYNIDYKGNKSGGFNNVVPRMNSTQVINGLKVQTGTLRAPNKFESFNSAMQVIDDILQTLKQSWDDITFDGGVWNGKINPDIVAKMPLCIERMTKKMEARIDGKKEKTRFFFIGPTFEYLITTHYFDAFHQHTANTLENFLSCAFAYGASSTIEAHLNPYNEPDREYSHGDVYKKDDSAQAQILFSYIILVIPYLKMSDYDKFVALHLICFIGLYMSHHIVLWCEFLLRMIYGSLSSGKKLTSDFNTKHMIILWLCFLLTFKKWKYLFDRRLAFGDQGDNVISGLPKGHEVTFKGFVEFCAKHNQIIRDAATFDSMYVEIDETTGEYVKEGLVFLQRSFTKNGPARPWHVYLRKLMISVKSMTRARFLMKVIGLAFDNGGTNIYAHKALSAVYWHFRKKWGLSVSEEDYEAYKGDLERSFKYKWSFELLYEDFSSFPDLNVIQHLYRTKEPPLNMAKHVFHTNTPRPKYEY